MPVERTALGPREVRLRVIRSGVCHSDVHLRTGFHDLGGGTRVPLVERGFTYPLVLGHEVVGVVEEVGAEVAEVTPGDVRLVYPWIGCGTCRRCTAGRDDLCAAHRALGAVLPGGYAETVVVPEARYLLAVDGIDPAVAATLACSGLTAFGAASKVDAAPEAPVVVSGAGGVGLALVAILRAFGHRNICAIDHSVHSLRLAEGMGATSTVLAGDDLADRVREAVGEPVEAFVDLVNDGTTTRLGFDLLAKGGLLVAVGLFGGELRLPAVMLPLKAVRITGSYVGTLADLHTLVGLARDGGLPTVPVLPGTLDAAGVSDALDRLAEGGVRGRIVLET
ncbi:alcohol dehydrogenase catalytic domain-containing protein [Nocardioides sp. QY071]|uniref:alcohol dehydrogenase catalytic domain-containing protein n=1 Tax=Nocardioides sp. QY071 TaxID=3044187 RepID=UPI00249C71FE|nr:alcohol dehydrogenase catalytic domain-containing protein [Nocardioides sp. QY071]WGY00400.1 alcohol dehydrogenase catalytic domain-containing protein [Nocardioides sp. QY071]